MAKKSDNTTTNTTRQAGTVTWGQLREKGYDVPDDANDDDIATGYAVDRPVSADDPNAVLILQPDGTFEPAKVEESGVPVATAPEPA